MPVTIIYCHSVINKATGELQFQKLQEENPEMFRLQGDSNPYFPDAALLTTELRKPHVGCEANYEGFFFPIEGSDSICNEIKIML